MLFISFYLVFVVILKFKYSRLYKWNKGCYLEAICTDVMQPGMELIGNSMTAHFWHFEDYNPDDIEKVDENIICVFDRFLPQRKFDSSWVQSIISSIWVDINPNQRCVIIRPTTYTKLWKLAFPRDYDKSVFSVEKCSHIGAVKLVTDGKGCFFGVDNNNKPIELDIVEFCLAKERKDVLFV